MLSKDFFLKGDVPVSQNDACIYKAGGEYS